MDIASSIEQTIKEEDSVDSDSLSSSSGRSGKSLRAQSAKKIKMPFVGVSKVSDSDSYDYG